MISSLQVRQLDPLADEGRALTTYITLPSRYLVSCHAPEPVSRAYRRAQTEPIAIGCAGRPSLPVVESREAVYLAYGPAKTRPPKPLADMHYLPSCASSFCTPHGSGAPIPAIWCTTCLFTSVSCGTLIARLSIGGSSIKRARIGRCRTFRREPSCRNRCRVLKLYGGALPHVATHMSREIQKAPGRKVSLNQSVYLISTQTESRTTIVRSTRRVLATENLEDTIFRPILRPAVTICEALRLRNLGGAPGPPIITRLHRHGGAEQLLRQSHSAPGEAEAATITVDRRISLVLSFALGTGRNDAQATALKFEHLLSRPCPPLKDGGFVKTAETVSTSLSP